MRDTAYMLLLDGFADWEASLAASEINKSDRYQIIAAGLSRQPHPLVIWLNWKRQSVWKDWYDDAIR